jgi:hypothetical protein
VAVGGQRYMDRGVLTGIQSGDGTCGVCGGCCRIEMISLCGGVVGGAFVGIFVCGGGSGDKVWQGLLQSGG